MRASAWAGVGAGLGLLLLLGTGWGPGRLPYVPAAAFSDAVTSHWPAAHILREAVWAQGVFPLWQEHILASGPFAANPLNKLAYPPQWVALLLPPTAHLTVIIVAHMVLAGVGLWAWARAEGASAVGALVGALAYALAPRVLLYLGAGHLDVLYALAWWPWLMAAVGPWPGRGGRRMLIVLRAGVLAALLLLADVRLAVYALPTATVYALWTVWRTRQWWRAGVLTLTGVPVVLLGAALWGPLLLWGPHLSRGDITAAGTFPVTPGALSGVLIPAAAATYEDATYLGWPLLVLALVGWWAQPRALRVFWGGLCVFAAVYALGHHTPLWTTVVRMAPFLLWERVPARAWFVLALAGAYLAAHGVDALAHVARMLRGGQRPAWLRPMRLSLMGLLALLGSAGAGLWLFVPPVRAAGGLLLINAVGLGVVFGGVLTGRLAGRALIGLLVAVLWLDLTGAALMRLTWRGPNVWLQPYAPLARQVAALGPGRVYVPDTVTLPQWAATAHGLRLFNGVDPFQVRGVVRAIARGSGVPVTAYGVVLPPPVGGLGDNLTGANRGATPHVPTLAAWGVTHVVAPFPIQVRGLALAAQDAAGTRIYAVAGARPVSGWPEAWPGLPDSTVLAHNARWTLAAFVVSAVGWLVVIVLEGGVWWATRTRR